jgi:hypothetical protein
MQPPGGVAARSQEIQAAKRVRGSGTARRLPTAAGYALTGREPTSFGLTGIRCAARPGCLLTGVRQDVRADRLLPIRVEQWRFLAADPLNHAVPAISGFA